MQMKCSKRIMGLANAPISLPASHDGNSTKSGTSIHLPSTSNKYQQVQMNRCSCVILSTKESIYNGCTVAATMPPATTSRV